MGVCWYAKRKSTVWYSPKKRRWLTVVSFDGSPLKLTRWEFQKNLLSPHPVRGLKLLSEDYYCFQLTAYCQRFMKKSWKLACCVFHSNCFPFCDSDISNIGEVPYLYRKPKTREFCRVIWTDLWRRADSRSLSVVSEKFIMRKILAQPDIDAVFANNFHIQII